MDFPDLSSQRFLTLLFIETYCHEKFTIHQPTAAIMGLLIVIGVGCSKIELHDKTGNEPQYELMTGEDINVMNKIV